MMKNMMHGLAMRVEQMHKEQRQILKILMMQAYNNNAVNGAINNATTSITGPLQ